MGPTAISDFHLESADYYIDANLAASQQTKIIQDRGDIAKLSPQL
jgi:hypothetical protein